MIQNQEILCASCGASCSVETHPVINVGKEPGLKSKVLDGSLFIWECRGCGTKNLLRNPLVYIDPAEKLIAILSEEDLNFEIPDDGEFAGFTSRQVKSVGELVELVKIFDAGLDDEVIDLCKQVTAMELKKNDIRLKFFRLEGADNEIIFTFPEEGEMKIIAIGFNVYEDCKAIIDGHRR